VTAPNDTLLNTIGIPTVGGNYFSLYTLGALVGMIRLKLFTILLKYYLINNNIIIASLSLTSDGKIIIKKTAG